MSGLGIIKRSGACAALLLALAAAAASGASEDNVSAFTISVDKRNLTASAENQWVTVADPSGSPASARMGRYLEGVELGFSGSIYHPDLFRWVLESRLGLSQQEGDARIVGSPSQSLNATLHFLASMLQKKPFSFSVYADRRGDYPGYKILDPAQVSRTALGGFARWANGYAPVSFSLEKSWKTDQEPNWNAVENVLQIGVSADRTSADQDRVSRAQYAFSNFDRSTNGAATQQGTSHDARLANTLSFGRASDQKLASSVRYLSLSGTLQDQGLDIAEFLDLTLPWNLHGQASYELNAHGLATSNTLAHQGRLQLRHQLFESLTSTVGATAALTSASTYRQKLVGPDLDLRYRKRIRIGVLNLGYGISSALEDRQASGQNAQITAEPHTLSDGTVTFLDYPNADPSSVVVTDQSGTILYVAGVDYVVTAIDGKLQIRRVAGGRIANGATVLVDYSLVQDVSFTRAALKQSAAASLELLGGGVVLSYRYQRSRYPYSVGAAAQSLELSDDHLAGIGLNFTTLTGSLEYEHLGSSLIPWDALRAQESLSWPIEGRSLLEFQGAQSLTWFAQSPGPQSFVELVAHYSFTAGTSTIFRLGGGYRLQADPGSALQSTVSAEAGMDYTQGAIKLSVDYKLRGTSTGGGMHPDHTLSVSLNKEF